MERKHEIKIKFHDVEKEEIEKFLNDFPEFRDIETVVRQSIFEYMVAYRKAKKHILKACMKIIG